jgi:phage terminase Nu1 subunit (DNA packaging protein)
MINKTSLKTLKQVEIAALLGVTERRIQQLHGEGLPRNGEGRSGVYVWEDVLAWYLARISCSGKDGEALTDRQRREKAEADMAEMEAGKMAGTLLDADEAQAEWEASLSRLRSNLLGFPDRIVPRLEEGGSLAEKLAICRKEMHSTLRDIVAQEGME